MDITVNQYKKRGRVMGKLIMIMAMAVYGVVSFAQVRDAKNFKFADGAIYCINQYKSELPIFKDGYFGLAMVRFDSNTASKYIHVTAKGVEKTLFLVGNTPDKQSMQYLLIKNSGGMLKAFAMIDATPEQIKECMNNRKAFEYKRESSGIPIQDGDKPCTNCKGTGKLEKQKSVKKGTDYKSMTYYDLCETCKGTGKVPHMVYVPEIKFVE
jgi:hypothetical protein